MWCEGCFKLFCEAIWELWISLDLMDTLISWLIGFDRSYNCFTAASKPEQFLRFPPTKEILGVWGRHFEIYEILYPEYNEYCWPLASVVNEELLYGPSFLLYSFGETLISWQLFYLKLLLNNVDSWENPPGVSAELLLRLILLWCKIVTASIFTIWARGVGPRLRPDQLSDLTWKDSLLNLLGFLIIIIYYLLVD